MLCSYCGLSFALNKEHIRLVHLNEKENRCMFCGELFENVDKMFDHVTEHDGLIFCFKCKEPSNNYELLMNHIDIHSELHVYGCTKCLWTTANIISYQNHICQKITDNGSGHDSGIELNLTVAVNSKVKNENEKEQYHLNNISLQQRDCDSVKFMTGCLGKKGYMCPECPKLYKTLRSFRYHLLKHKNLLPFLCDICDKKFPNLNKLKYHKKLHSLNLKRHRCPQCNKIYKTKYSLKIHSWQHKGGFHCAHCNKPFTVKHHLKKHLNIRKCCGKIFRCKTSMTRHLLLAKHGVPCKYCDVRLLTEGLINRHISIRHRETVGKYSCVNCGMLFISIKTLNRHRKRHTLEKNGEI